MDEIYREKNDAMSQKDVAKRSGMDHTTVSQVMKKLSKEGLVDVGPDIVWPGSRILLTRKGELAARAGAAEAEEVSAAWLEERDRKKLRSRENDRREARDRL
jgi:DNA-binding MarR family transcriptional regulator